MTFGVYIGPRLPECPISEWDILHPKGYGNLKKYGASVSGTFEGLQRWIKHWRGVDASKRFGRKLENGVVVAKQCTNCGITKTLAEFHVAPFSHDGHHNVCRACKSKFDKDRTARKGRPKTKTTPCRKPD